MRTKPGRRVNAAATEEAATSWPTLRRSAANPHYLEFRGRTGPLLTSAEHYGALLNLDFDYETYFRTLASLGFNQTRLFSGTYREIPGAFQIADNTLAPKPGRFACPWPVCDRRRERYDLDRFSASYFRRLDSLMQAASRRGVVVEFVLFCYLYNEALWEACPFHPARNVNGVGRDAAGRPLERRQVYDPSRTALMAAQERFVRKVVRALNRFDNLYYEICNEPYCNNDGTAFEAWQARIAATIRATEAALPRRHCIAQNVANRTRRAAAGLCPGVEIVNFHYAEPSAVGDNYDLGLVISDDETGFKGQAPTPYRREAWEFLLGGGGIFSHLDYSFTVGSPDGTAPVAGLTPGFGGPVWRGQLAVLKRFLDGFDLAAMAPHHEVCGNLLPPGASVAILAEHGRQYAAYAWSGGAALALTLGLPRGRYDVEVIAPGTGAVIRREDLRHAGGGYTICQAGQWGSVLGEDLAASIRRR